MIEKFEINNEEISSNKINTGDDFDWKNQLSDEQYRVTREKGTEKPFQNKYWNNHETGIYLCVCCGKPLFESQNKFDSGTVWPSFSQPVLKTSVKENADNSFGMNRTEIQCQNCGAHLGHLFDDGPMPGGMRYCVNSASLNFKNFNQKK